MATVYYPPVLHGASTAQAAGVYPHYEPVVVAGVYRPPLHLVQPQMAHGNAHANAHHMRRHSQVPQVSTQPVYDNNVYMPSQMNQMNQLNPGMGSSYRPVYVNHNQTQMAPPYYYGGMPSRYELKHKTLNAGVSNNNSLAPSQGLTQSGSCSYWQKPQPQLLPPPIQQVPQVPHVPHVAPPMVNNMLEPVKEPPTGGVASSLDYEFTDMADFLATMGCGILVNSSGSLADQRSPVIEGQWSSASHMAYLKQFLIQVLSATRLPRSTIILGLVYMSKRWAVTSLNTGNIPTTDVVYKMIIVGLILANKFHDDNTFTNQSWGKATQFSIKDLTTFETGWLSDIKWSLHLSQNDNIAWHKWDDCWQLYVKSKSLDAAATTVKGFPLSPVSMSSPESGLLNMSSPGLTGSSATSPFPCEPLSPTHQRSYTIPKWYETANKGVDPVVSHFQQTQSSHHLLSVNSQTIIAPQVSEMAPVNVHHNPGNNHARSHVQSHGLGHGNSHGQGHIRYSYPSVSSRGPMHAGSLPLVSDETGYYSQGLPDACYYNTVFERPTDWFSVAAC